MKRPARKFGLIIVAVLAVAACALAIPSVRRLFHPLAMRADTPKTVEDRLAEFTDARERVRVNFAKAGVPFPPARVVLLGLKDEKRLEVYASGSADQSMRRVASYPIQAASGVAGPKLREGDKQVPEGVYPVELLNPNSRFHVALRVGYPSTFDRAMADQDGRTKNGTPLGGDIMIHGGAESIGCLAMGDPVAEELFVLSALTGIENVTIVIAPMDLRTRELPSGLDEGWRREMYDAVRAQLAKLPQ